MPLNGAIVSMARDAAVIRQPLPAFGRCGKRSGYKPVTGGLLLWRQAVTAFG
jgi:hypothetical protein